MEGCFKKGAQTSNTEILFCFECVQTKGSRTWHQIIIHKKVVRTNFVWLLWKICILSVCLFQMIQPVPLVASFWRTMCELTLRSSHQRWPISSSRNASTISEISHRWSEPPLASWSPPSLPRESFVTGQSCCLTCVSVWIQKNTMCVRCVLLLLGFSTGSIATKLPSV